MRNLHALLAVVAALAAGALVAAPGSRRRAKPHRIAFHVDQNDPAVMNLVLNNVSNLMEYYHGKGEQVQIEVVAYGPGLNMLREDTSPVKDRLKRINERHLSLEREVFRLRQHQEGHGKARRPSRFPSFPRRRSCRPASCA